MCYDVRYLTQKLRKYVDRIGADAQEVTKLENQLKVFTDEIGPVYHTTAFDHWRLPVITNDRPEDFQFFHWGLIPHFVKDSEHYASRYTSRYLNSRIETLFEEKLFNQKLNRDLDNPFFRSALERRCLVILDSYFDWHWQGKNSYNFQVMLKNEAPMMVAGIWRRWESKSEGIVRDTVSMITTDANALCRKVHNKPKASEGPRQLAMLDDEAARAWLEPDHEPEQLRKIIRVFPESELKAFPVKKLFLQQGRSRVPLNDADCVKMANYPELEFKGKDAQGSLFE